MSALRLSSLAALSQLRTCPQGERHRLVTAVCGSTGTPGGHGQR